MYLFDTCVCKQNRIPKKLTMTNRSLEYKGISKQAFQKKLYIWNWVEEESNEFYIDCVKGLVHGLLSHLLLQHYGNI